MVYGKDGWRLKNDRGRGCAEGVLIGKDNPAV